jgi:hypothetical protein
MIDFSSGSLLKKNTHNNNNNNNNNNNRFITQYGRYEYHKQDYVDRGGWVDYEIQTTL